MAADDHKQKLLDLVDRDRALAAVTTLAGLPVPSDLRRILRPHWQDEEAVRSPAEIALRDGFDAELEWLMLLELAVETGYLAEEDIVAEVLPQTRKLLNEPAVARFVDAYLYFGIRFIAGRLERLKDPSAAAEAEPRVQLLEDEPSEKPNIRQFHLPDPPRLADFDPVVEGFLELERQLQAGDAVQAALRFLDDYVGYVGEQQDYLLWLRGLLSSEGLSPAWDRFPAISRGLLAWVGAKAAFYAKLPTDALRARFGVFDFYYLARSLGAEVTPAGAVKYQDRSWLLELEEFPQIAGVEPGRLREQEEHLRLAFSLACDLIQEGIVIASEELIDGQRERRDKPGKLRSILERLLPRSRRTQDGEQDDQFRTWRFVHDEEIAEIRAQRHERSGRDNLGGAFQGETEGVR